MEFPKLDFADEEACFEALLELVHPGGLRCPHCGQQEGLHIHGHHKHNCTPYYRCSRCRQKFSPWAGTVFEGTHHSPSDLWRIIQRLTAGWHLTDIARELHCQRARLSEFCHKIAPFVWKHFGPPPKKPPQKNSQTGHESGIQSQPAKKSCEIPYSREADPNSS